MGAIQQFRLTLVSAACIIVLQACAVAPERSSFGGADSDLDDVQLSNEINDLREGDMAQFRTGALAKFGTILVGREYDAASGRSCKQLLDASGEQLLSVACQLPTKQWYVRESLHVPADAMRFVPVNTDPKPLLVPAEPQTRRLKHKIQTEPAVEQVQDSVSYKVEQDETLYSFARRTTGNALNWEEIAKYNGITNEFVLDVGTALKIPSALQKR